MATRRGGIDLGGTKIQAIVVDDDDNVLGQARHPTPKDGGPQGVADGIVAALAEAAADAGIDVSELAGVGIGSPGAIDEDRGTVTQARNVTPDWTGEFALGPAVASASGVANVKLGHDVAVGTRAEHQLGAAKGYDDVLGVFWGTGVGAGLILGGKPWRGRGAAGEIGHMVIERGGAQCTCGRIGCMEAYAGRKAMELEARHRVQKGEHTKLFKIMEERGREQLSSGIWARAMDHHDDLAKHLIHRAVKALGAGIASAVNLLDVQIVVIGGGLGTRLGEPYVEKIREAMHPHLFVDEHPPDVRLSTLGDLGGALGAALLIKG
jgi:glucokinase